MLSILVIYVFIYSLAQIKVHAIISTDVNSDHFYSPKMQTIIKYKDRPRTEIEKK